MRRWKWLVAGVLGVLTVGLMGMTLHASTDTTTSKGSPPGGASGTAVGTLSVTGTKMGVIASDKGPIVVTGYSHEVLMPRDAASGMATGKRMHKPITITKELDKSTPLLMQALVTNEVLKNVTLSVPVGVGSYTITLTNAGLAGIQQTSSENSPAPQEVVSFTYQKITWTYSDGKSKTMATDDWQADR